MYTYEEYSKVNALGSLMTGTVLGFLKWSDMVDKDKKTLAKQLQWCYEHSGAEIPASVQKDIQDILSA